MVGRKVLEQGSYWTNTLGTFAVCGGIALVWVCDWKLVYGQVPVLGKGLDREPPK